MFLDFITVEAGKDIDSMIFWLATQRDIGDISCPCRRCRTYLWILDQLGHKETQPVAENMHASVAHMAEWWGLTSDAFIVDQQKPAPWVFWITHRSRRCGNSFEVYLCKTSKSNPSYTCYCHCLQLFCFWDSGLFTDVFVAMVFLAHWSFGLSFVALCVRSLSFGDFSFGKLQNNALELPVEHMNTVKVYQIWIDFQTPMFTCFCCTWWPFDPPAQFLIRDIGSRDAHQSIRSCSGAEFCRRVAWPCRWLNHQEMGSSLALK